MENSGSTSPIIHASESSSEDPHRHGEPQPEAAREVALLLRQAADQDGDEDDVVDAEDDFQCRQRHQGDPFACGSVIHCIPETSEGLRSQYVSMSLECF